MKLKEIVEICYGKSQKQVEVEKSDIPILGTGGVIGFSSLPLYNDESVLIGRKGTIGMPFYIDKPFWTIDTLFYTKINKNIVIPKYLYYLLCKAGLDRYSEGAAIPSLTTKTLNEIELNIHKMPIQQHIVNTIGSVDDLIEKNTQISSKIEQILFSIYNKKIDNTISFKASTFFDCFNGGTFKSSDYVDYSKEKLITIKNIDQNGFSSENATYFKMNEKYKKYALNVGDVLLTMTGAYLGRVGIVDDFDCYLNQRVLRIKCISKSFCYTFLKLNEKRIFNLGRGSAQPNLSLDDFNNMEIHFDACDVSSFIKYDYLFDELINYKIKTRKLRQIKQLLLSKYF